MSDTSLAFEFRPGQSVRVVKIDEHGEPWFVARDALAVLHLKNNTSLGSLHPDDKGTHTVGTLGGPQQMTVVNESGLYDLVLKSRRREARAIRRWVTREVLPSIRRTGGYFRPGLTRSHAPDAAPYATPDEIERLRFLAQHVCRAEGTQMRALWNESIGKYGLKATRRAFGEVPRCHVEQLFEDLRARLNSPITGVSPAAVVPPPYRAANPKVDLDPSQVVEALDVVRDVEALTTPIVGFYDFLELNPLHAGASRRRRNNDVPYLDRTRLEILQAWLLDNPHQAEALMIACRKIPSEIWQAFKDGAPAPQNGWDVFIKRRMNYPPFFRWRRSST